MKIFIIACIISTLLVIAIFYHLNIFSNTQGGKGVVKIFVTIGFLSVFVSVLAMYKTLGFSVQRNEKEKLVLKGGVVAQARVVSMMDAGRRQDRHPEMTFELEVFPASSSSYFVKITTFVSIYQLSKLIPGAMISVKLDSNDPTAVIIIKQQ